MGQSRPIWGRATPIRGTIRIRNLPDCHYFPVASGLHIYTDGKRAKKSNIKEIQISLLRKLERPVTEGES